MKLPRATLLWFATIPILLLLNEKVYCATKGLDEHVTEKDCLQSSDTLVGTDDLDLIELTDATAMLSLTQPADTLGLIQPADILDLIQIADSLPTTQPSDTPPMGTPSLFPPCDTTTINCVCMSGKHNQFIGKVQKIDWPKYWDTIFATDNVGLYTTISKIPFMESLSKSELYNKVIKYDAISIFSMLSLDIKREIATCAYTIAEYAPEKIMNEIFESIHDLHANTSLIAPHEVKSIKALRYLFHVGYDQIPRFCLQIRNGQWTLHYECVQYLTEQDCSGLLQELFQGNPLYALDRMGESGVSLSTPNVLKWLFTTSLWSLKYNQLLAVQAIEDGCLKVVEGMASEFHDHIDWNGLLEIKGLDTKSSEIAPYLRTQFPAIKWTPAVELLFAVSEDNLDGLKAKVGKPIVASPIWQGVANAAARFGRVRILQWIYDKFRILPEMLAVEDASEYGHLCVLKWIHSLDFDSNFDVALRVDVISSERCITRASLGKQLEIMNWIYENLPGRVLPDLDIMYSNGPTWFDDTYYDVFEWIILKDSTKIEHVMLLTAELGPLRVFRRLVDQGYLIIPKAVKRAAKGLNLKILMTMHEIDSEMVCTLKIANLVKRSDEVHRYDILNWIYFTCGILPDYLYEKGEDLAWIVTQHQQ